MAQANSGNGRNRHARLLSVLSEKVGKTLMPAAVGLILAPGALQEAGFEFPCGESGGDAAPSVIAENQIEDLSPRISTHDFVLVLSFSKDWDTCTKYRP
ncbi:hypothetical protein [Achromobacter arsenitoxydans]|uniref:hypothetical protein n=1 Tax=Achromobacter arsenitoxydans TaxID=1147684 RepID=UPI001427DDB3|nr:hypothetical protein [Achromobacter arsenitoxydans]